MHRISSTGASFSRRTLLESMLAAGAVAATTSGPALAGEPRAATDLHASPANAAATADRFRELGDFVTRRMTELKVPGVAVGVIADGEEFMAGFGVTNVDHPLPVDANTRFQIGSATKTFTGMAVMRLVEHGTLDLEAPVRTYLPDFRVADSLVSEEVRLRHLVTHTAGWYGDFDLETGDGDDALARFVGAMADLPQIAPLGEYFSYNNAAVCLAGRLIEAVTGQSYEAAVAELVLQPLGLDQTAFFAEAIMTKAFAVGHDMPRNDPDGEPVVLQPWVVPRSANPVGGLAASVNDGLRYARFHLGDGTANGTRVLTAEGLRRMQTPFGPGGSVPSIGVRLEGVGVNWMVWNQGGVRIVSHPGGGNGQQSTLSIIPERDFAMTVLTNAQTGALLTLEVTNWALERFLGLRQSVETTVVVDRSRLAEYAGEYAVPVGMETIRVREEDDVLRLALLVSGQSVVESPLRLVGDDLAIAKYLWMPVLNDFVRNDAGKVAWVRFLGRLLPRVT